MEEEKPPEGSEFSAHGAGAADLDDSDDEILYLSDDEDLDDSEDDEILDLSDDEEVDDSEDDEIFDFSDDEDLDDSEDDEIIDLSDDEDWDEDDSDAEILDRSDDEDLDEDDSDDEFLDVSDDKDVNAGDSDAVYSADAADPVASHASHASAASFASVASHASFTSVPSHASHASNSDDSDDSDDWGSSEGSGWFTDPDVEGQERYFDGTDWTPDTRPLESDTPLSHLPDHAGELQRALAAATDDIDDVEDRLGNLFDRIEHADRKGRARKKVEADAAGPGAQGGALADPGEQDPGQSGLAGAEDGSASDLDWDIFEEDDALALGDDDAIADLDEALVSEEPEKVKRGFFRRH
jgi:hypothetical protein